MVVYPPWTREVAGSNPAFQTICSISIEVSAFGFLPNDKGSIPLWSTNDFVAQWLEYRFHKPKVEGLSPSEITKKLFCSSMVERWSVKPEVESSSLSGIANN